MKLVGCLMVQRPLQGKFDFSYHDPFNKSKPEIKTHLLKQVCFYSTVIPGQSPSKLTTVEK